MNTAINPLPSRRTFLATGASAAGVLASTPLRAIAADPASATAKEPLYKISLAQWSLHNTLFSGKLDNLDFPRTAKQQFGIDGVEYVNQFFKDKAQDADYIADLAKRAADEGVTNVLIMCDGLGNLGDPDDKARTAAIEKHYPWVEAANSTGHPATRSTSASDQAAARRPGKP